MDRASIIGILLAFGGLFIGQVVEGANILTVIQPAAFFIVVFGTFGAVLLQSRLPTFMRGIKMVRSVFVAPEDRQAKLVRDALMWNMSARREGLLSLENFLRNIKDPFTAKGMRMVIDGVKAERIKDMLEIDISSYELHQWQAVRVWEAAGGYSPTIGILGAVLGLIHVMEHLADPTKLGSGIAVAFVATVYGVGLANLIYLPIAHKLKDLVAKEIEQKEFLTDVFFSIASGENSMMIEDRALKYA